MGAPCEPIGAWKGHFPSLCTFFSNFSLYFSRTSLQEVLFSLYFFRGALRCPSKKYRVNRPLRHLVCCIEQSLNMPLTPFAHPHPHQQPPYGSPPSLPSRPGPSCPHSHGGLSTAHPTVPLSFTECNIKKKNCTMFWNEWKSIFWFLIFFCVKNLTIWLKWYLQKWNTQPAKKNVYSNLLQYFYFNNFFVLKFFCSTN